jgi:hypothetical protein
VAAIPPLYLAGVFTFWLLLVFVLSCINTPGDSARYALIPGLAGRARMPLERANAADRAIARLAQVVGPLLAGGLIALLGAANVLFVDAGTFVASAALVAVGVPSAASARVEAEAPGTGRAGYMPELLDGLRFVRWTRWWRPRRWRSWWRPVRSPAWSRARSPAVQDRHPGADTAPGARAGVRRPPGDGWHLVRDGAGGLRGRGGGTHPYHHGRGVIYVAVTLSMFVRPPLRRMDVPANR